MSENKELGDAVDKFRALLADCTESEMQQAKAIFCDVLGITEADLRTHENESEAGAVAEIYVVEDFETGADVNTIHCLDYKLIENLPHGAKLYLAPPSAKAIEAAAIMRAEDCVIRTFNELQFKDSDTQLCVKAALGDVRVKLRALIPQDGRTALEEFGWEVAHAILDARREGLLDGNDIRAIVTNLIGVPPLNSGTVSGEE